MAEVVLPSGVVVRLPLSSTPDAVTRLVTPWGRLHADLCCSKRILLPSTWTAAGIDSRRRGAVGFRAIRLGTTFKNRRDKLKILAWMGDGFALYLRRLERGTFCFPSARTLA